MKRLSSQFKKLLFDKIFSRQNFPLLAACAVVTVVVSCSVRKNSEPQSSILTYSAPLDALQEKSGDPDDGLTWFNLVSGETTVAQIATDSCDHSDLHGKEIIWKIPFKSAVGVHGMKLSYQQTSVSNHGLVTIDGQKIDLQLTARPTIDELQAICKHFDDNEKSLAIRPAVAGFLKATVESVIPDCSGVIDESGVYCQLPKLKSSLAKDKIDKIINNMIRRWSRQPYILSRRIAVTSTLAQANLSSEKNRRLQAFCNVIGNSLHEELPLAFHSQEFRRTICNAQTLIDERQMTEAIEVALHKAVEELEFLKELFEKSSKLGYLTLRVPKEKVPDRTVWVNLYPMEDVGQQLAESAATNWQATTEGVSTIPRTCWHPLFSPYNGSLYLARYLNLTKHSNSSNCEERVPTERRFVPRNYIADSITSETEFVVTNGRAIILRLPQGSYTYTLAPLPDNPDNWDDAASIGPQSSGTIEWKGRKPNTKISTW